MAHKGTTYTPGWLEYIVQKLRDAGYVLVLPACRSVLRYNVVPRGQRRPRVLPL